MSQGQVLSKHLKGLVKVWLYPSLKTIHSEIKKDMINVLLFGQTGMAKAMTPLL